MGRWFTRQCRVPSLTLIVRVHVHFFVFFWSRSSVMQAAAGIMHIILNTIISIRVAVHVSRLITCNSLMRCVYGFITLKCQRNFKESISRPLSLLCEMKQFVQPSLSLSLSLSVALMASLLLSAHPGASAVKLARCVLMIHLIYQIKRTHWLIIDLHLP